MKELTNIANQLAVLYIERGRNLEDRTDLKRELAKIELQLLPDGAQGKNEEERKRNRIAVLNANERYADMEELLHRVECALCLVESQISAFEAQRRAIEWQIRAAYIGYGERTGADGSDFDSVADVRITPDPPMPMSDELRDFDAAISRQFEPF